MANNNLLKASIAAVIKTNGTGAITGSLLQDALNSIINQFGAGCIFKGVATLSTAPGTIDQNVFYLAGAPGVYPNFGGYDNANGDVVVFSNITGAFVATKILDVSLLAKKTDIQEIHDELDGTQETVNIPLSFTSDNRAYNLTGDLIASTNGKWAAPIDVSGYAKITLTFSLHASSSGSARAIVVKSATNAVLLAIYEKGVPTVGGVKVLEFDVTNQKTIYISCSVNANVTLQGLVIETGIYDDIDLINAKIPVLEASIQTNATAIANANKRIDGGEDVTVLPFTTTSGGYFNSGGVIVVGTGVYTSNIPITGYDKIRIKKPDASTTSTRASIIYNNAAGIVTTFQENQIGAGREYNVLSNWSYIKLSFTAGTIVVEGIKIVKGLEVIDVLYVSANGSSSNSGSASSPLLSLKDAITKIRDNGTVRILASGGVFENPENVDLSAISNKTIRISTIGNVVFKGGLTVVGDGTEQVVTDYPNVRQMAASTGLSNTGLYDLWQHNINDPNSAIEYEYPMFLGMTHRLSSTKIRHVSEYFRTSRTIIAPYTRIQALAAMNTQKANNKFYWFVGDDGITYFTAPQVSSAANPIISPQIQNFIGGNNGTVRILMDSPFTVMYRNLGLQLCHNSVFRIKGMFSSSNPFNYGASMFTEFINCEACGGKENETGDGFNGHGENVGPTIVTFKNCWTHDNNDDGQSEHGNTEITIIDGLAEYNGKAGYTPVLSNAKYKFINCISRKNNDGTTYGGGFDLVNGSYVNSTVYFENCSAYDNGVTDYLVRYATLNRCYSQRTPTGWVIGQNVKTFDCKAIGHNVGVNVPSSGNMQNVDFRTAGCTTNRNGSGVYANVLTTGLV